MGCLFTFAAAGGVGGLGGLGDGKHHVVTEGLAVGPGNNGTLFGKSKGIESQYTIPAYLKNS